MDAPTIDQLRLIYPAAQVLGWFGQMTNNEELKVFHVDSYNNERGKRFQGVIVGSKFALDAIPQFDNVKRMTVSRVTKRLIQNYVNEADYMYQDVSWNLVTVWFNGIID